MLKNMDVSFFLAYRSIRRGNKGTLFLTVMLMSLIFVNLIFLPSIINGIGETINQNMIDYSYANILIEPKENNLYIDNADNVQKKLNKQNGVAGVAPHYITGATFSYKDKFISGVLYSIDPDDEETVTQVYAKLIDGEYLSKADTDEILIGIDSAGIEGVESEERNLGGVKVGDKIDVSYSNGVIKEYRVKGIFKTKAFTVDGAAFITEKEMESVLGLDNKASEILVKITQRGSEEQFRTKFVELGISEDIKTWEEKSAGFVEEILGSFFLITLISTVISLVIAVVIIFIVTYINTVNKRRQIGILKAIGIDQGVIINSYVIQALFYCISGIFIGSVLLYVLTSYLFINPIKFPMGYIWPLVDLQLLIQSIASLIVVSLIAGYIPSWRTAKEDILKTIWG